MDKKNNYRRTLVILSIFIVILLICIVYLTKELKVFQYNKDVHGTFMKEEFNMDYEYLLFDNETKEFYWYKENEFYKKGSYIRLGEDNIYRIKVNNNDIYAIYYKNSISLIAKDEVLHFDKIANYLLFIDDKY